MKTDGELKGLTAERTIPSRGPGEGGGGSAPVNNAGYYIEKMSVRQVSSRERERENPVQTKTKSFSAPRSTPRSRYHGNGVHRIKTLNRSIRILPRTGTSLLILPGLSQALLGNLCVFFSPWRKSRKNTLPRFPEIIVRATAQKSALDVSILTVGQICAQETTVNREPALNLKKKKHL